MLKSRSRKTAKRLSLAMLMLSLLALTSCATSTVYLRGTSEAVKLEAGAAAPHSGWLIQDEALADLLECCSAKQSE